MEGLSIPEPLEHSVLDEDLEVDLWRGDRAPDH